MSAWRQVPPPYLKAFRLGIKPAENALRGAGGYWETEGKMPFRVEPVLRGSCHL